MIFLVYPSALLLLLPPTQTNPNIINVITGVKIDEISTGVLGLFIQWGQLDVTQPSAPVVHQVDPNLLSS